MGNIGRVLHKGRCATERDSKYRSAAWQTSELFSPERFGTESKELEMLSISLSVPGR